MKTQWLRDLKLDDEVDTTVAVVECKVLQTKRGGEYLTYVVSDCTGKRPAKQWKPLAYEINLARSYRFLHIRGKVTEYNNATEITLSCSPEVIPEPADLSDYILASPVSLPGLEERLEAHVSTVMDPRLHAVLRAVYYDDAVSSERLRCYPAAMDRHHAFRYGLLQHTLEVTDVVAAITDCQHRWQGYPIWRDLAVTGALLHDIGKIDELETAGNAYTFTTSGTLLGHISQGMVRVARQIAKVKRQGVAFPAQLEDLLLHLISSHHGRGEWGSPTEPLMPEAILIHMADKTSVELFYMQEARANAAEGVEVVRQRKLDSGFGPGGRNVFVGDLNALRAGGFADQAAIQSPKAVAGSRSVAGAKLLGGVDALQALNITELQPSAALDVDSDSGKIVHHTKPSDHSETVYPGETADLTTAADHSETGEQVKITDRNPIDYPAETADLSQGTYRPLPILKLLDSDENDDDTVVALVLPVYGKIAAGQPLSDSDYLDGEECIDVSPLGEDITPDYLLRIQGDSMIGDGIEDGDLVAVRYGTGAEPGDLIVAMLEEGATVKRLINEGGALFLAPSNAAHMRIAIPDSAGLKVQGHVLGIVRR